MLVSLRCFPYHVVVNWQMGPVIMLHLFVFLCSVLCELKRNRGFGGGSHFLGFRVLGTNEFMIREKISVTDNGLLNKCQ